MVIRSFERKTRANNGGPRRSHEGTPEKSERRSSIPRPSSSRPVVGVVVADGIFDWLRRGDGLGRGSHVIGY